MGGTKAGVIAYLGETKFAGGDWAGVILDELEGKNDGMVQGIRYFQCEPKRGVFAKPSKLSRHKINRYIYFFFVFWCLPSLDAFNFTTRTSSQCFYP